MIPYFQVYTVLCKQTKKFNVILTSCQMAGRCNRHGQCHWCSRAFRAQRFGYWWQLLNNYFNNAKNASESKPFWSSQPLACTQYGLTEVKYITTPHHITSHHITSHNPPNAQPPPLWHKPPHEQGIASLVLVSSGCRMWWHFGQIVGI